MRAEPTLAAATLVLSAVFTLAGCGQKGPLTLPPPPAPAAAASVPAR